MSQTSQQCVACLCCVAAYQQRYTPVIGTPARNPAPENNSCHLVPFFNSRKEWEREASDSEGANPGHRRRPCATCVFVDPPVDVHGLEFVGQMP